MASNIERAALRVNSKGNVTKAVRGEDSSKIIDDPPAGREKGTVPWLGLNLIGKTPWILGLLVVLAGANPFAAIVFFPRLRALHASLAPGMKCIWLALIGWVLAIGRKAVLHEDRGAGAKTRRRKLVRLRGTQLRVLYSAHAILF